MPVFIQVFNIGADLPWVRNLDLVGYEGYLGIQVDDANFNWAMSFNASHNYAAFKTLAVPGSIGFRILDNNYSDNSGTLTVDIYPVIKGTTGEDGCVTFENIDYGTYKLDELMKDGWSNDSGKNTSAVVDQPKETFTLVNRCNTGCVSTVKICKLDSNQNPLSNWQVMLKGPKLETVSVNSNSSTGFNSTNTLSSGQNYLIVASGTWQNRGFETVDPRFTTPDGWTTVLDGPQGGYPNGLLEMQVDGQFVSWGPYATSHAYSLVTSGTGSTVNFRVFDGDTLTNTQYPDWFGDNNGTMTVDIYPVYSGTTGQDGCVTIENVPFGSYKLDEIMKDGWTNISGKNETKMVDTQNESFTLVNQCSENGCDRPIPKLHLIKVVCEEYGDVAGNESGSSADETNGNYVYFNNYNNGMFLPSPLVNGLVNPSEIPGKDSNCVRADGWKFNVSNESSFTSDDAQVLGATEDGEFVTPISGEDSALNPAMQSAIVSGQMWVSEQEKYGYEFAAIRCFNDALNGDNLEYISLGNNQPEHIYCIAYNIGSLTPCAEQDPAIASGMFTKFEGLKENTAPSDLSDEANYPLGIDAPAVLAGPTGHPGAWDGPQNDPDITEGSGVWVSNSAAQPTNPPGAGGDGSIDTWRLYSHTFTIPAGATSISPAILHFTADNEVTAFLDGVQVGFSNNYAVVSDSSPLALTSGTHVLKFAVKNWAYQPTNNPTGLIYNLDFNYCGDETGQGEPTYHATGTKWNDLDGDGEREEGENGIQDWTIYLTKKVAEYEVDSTSVTGVDSLPLTNGATYLVKASGTYDANDGILSDAQYSSRNLNPDWTDLVQNYEIYGPDLLDLQIDGNSSYWGPYTSSHIYWKTLTGTGAVVNFAINDIAPGNNTGTLDVEIFEVLSSTTTDSNGNYSFDVTDLTGNLAIVEGMQTGWQQSAPEGSLNVVPANADSINNDFGNHQVCVQRQEEKVRKSLFSIFTQIINDEPELPTCGNGISGTKYKYQSGNEELTPITLGGWVIYLDLNKNGELDDNEPYDTTDEDGNYSFVDLPTGTYFVREVGQEGWTQMTPADNGANQVLVTDSIETGQNFYNRDDEDGGGGSGGFKIKGTVYHDNNSNNGEYNSEAEEELQGWVVYLDADESNTLNGEEISTTSDSNGNYEFSGLVAGCYTVREVLQSSWSETEPSDGEYTVGIGGAFCSGPLETFNAQPHWYDFIIKTASAAFAGSFPGDASGLDFGNLFTGGGGSSGGGGGSTGGGPAPEVPNPTVGRVLGDSTNIPSTPTTGTVLGATTELPRTGTPAYVVMVMLATLGIILLPKYIAKQNN